MKLPNRYGTITKLSGTRRRPYIIKEGTSGKQKIIGYAATREEALNMLAEYNRNPWNIEKANLTLEALFYLWKDKRSQKLGASNRQMLFAAFNYLQPLKDRIFTSIKAFEMQDTIDTCERKASTKTFIKSLWTHLEKFAIELDITHNHYTSILTNPKQEETKKRHVFTEEEIRTLWANIKMPFVPAVLFLLYTGFRLSEFLKLNIEDININDRTMVGGVKTTAGKNRVVPIHQKLLPIIRQFIGDRTEGALLLDEKGKPCTIPKFRQNWHTVMKTLNMNHIPHECRHTLRTRLDRLNANKVCIDRILGHASHGTGERIYTHKTIEELKTVIDLLNE